MLSSVRGPLSFMVVGVLGLILGISLGAEPAAPSKEITNAIGMKLALIPEGKFVMGSPKDEKDREDENQHEVEITKPFYLGVFTVTVGQFRQFVKDAAYQTEAEKDEEGGFGYNADKKNFEESKKYNWQNVGWQQTADHPVVNVSWNDAVAFCNWLSKKEGNAYRLPTEAEWGYCCRAGTTTRYYSGDSMETLKAVANIADASFKQKYPQASWAMAWKDGYPFTSPAGKFKPNAFGLYDMHGNVWQWCADWKGDYPQDKIVDPQGPKDGKSRVLRGGSFNSDVVLVRSAHRNMLLPASHLFNVGFRVARTIAAE